MSHSTENQMKVQSNTQIFTEEEQLLKQSSGEQLRQIKEIKGTPFNMVKQESGYTITFADYKVSEEYETEEEALELIAEKNWKLISTLVIAIVDKYNKLEFPNN